MILHEREMFVLVLFFSYGHRNQENPKKYLLLYCPPPSRCVCHLAPFSCAEYNLDISPNTCCAFVISLL